MKTIKFFAVLLAVLFLGGTAFALQCSDSRVVGGASDDCWTAVTIASNETTLVSVGTVIVADIANAKVDADRASYQGRVSTASAQGVYVLGVAQQSIASGDTALVLVRGRGTLAFKTTETVTSGAAVFVSTSGDASVVTSTTQNQLGYALETTAISGNSRTTKKAYITIV